MKREAPVNAVVHRDYVECGTQILLEVFSDRIEVTSSGALPDDMTVHYVRRTCRSNSGRSWRRVAYGWAGGESMISYSGGPRCNVHVTLCQLCFTSCSCGRTR